MEAVGNTGLNWNSLQRYVSLPLYRFRHVANGRCSERKTSTLLPPPKLPLASPLIPPAMLPTVQSPSNLTHLRMSPFLHGDYSADKQGSQQVGERLQFDGPKPRSSVRYRPDLRKPSWCRSGRQYSLRKPEDQRL